MVSTIAYPFTVGAGSLLGCDTDSSELAMVETSGSFGGNGAEEASSCGCTSLALKTFRGYISPRLG
jgi:hypothetical protein